MNNIREKKHICEKLNKEVTLVVETVGVFGGDSKMPFNSFERKTCLSFPCITACHICDYRPS